MLPARQHLRPQQLPERWLLAGLGAVLTGAAVGHFDSHGHGDPMVVAATVSPAVALFGYGLWFCRRGSEDARGAAVFVWAVAGAGVVLTMDLSAILVGAYGEGAAVDHVFIQHTSVAALGTALAGTYSERARNRSRSESRLQRALGAAMDGVAVLDDDGQIIYANDAFRHEYAPAEEPAVVGTQWTNYYPGDDEQGAADVLERVDDEGHWQGRVLARRSDGRTYPQRLSVTALADGGYVCVSRDVTGREERDQRLRVLNRVLRHNVRNSLNVVRGRAKRIAERERGDESAEEDVESIVAAAEDLLSVSEKARVVEQVLEEDDTRDANLADLVATETDRVRSRYPDATFDVRVAVDTDVEVDARLRLAVRELLTNAVEHNDAETPRVSVVVRGRAPVELRVSDDGGGIPKQERRVLDGVKEQSLQHGSGIGLWTVYWLVRQSGADVEVDDENTVVIRVAPGVE